MLPRRLFPLASRFPGARHAAAARWGITAVTVVDTVTGEIFENEMARVPLRAASVIKVPILCAALHSRLAAKKGAIPPFSSSERADAEAMIRRSDNGATTRFWKSLGGSEVIRFIRGTAATRDSAVAPENPGWWGYTHTTSYDLAMVLSGLATRKLLPAAACDYVLQEMRLVTPDQRWGIPDGCTAPAAVAVKNGWYPEEDEGKVWRVHSVGVAPVREKADRAVISIMTRYPLERGMRYGQETCRLVAAEVLRTF